jgi:hypothetical protein
LRPVALGGIEMLFCVATGWLALVSTLRLKIDGGIDEAG